MRFWWAPIRDVHFCNIKATKKGKIQPILLKIFKNVKFRAKLAFNLDFEQFGANHLVGTTFYWTKNIEDRKIRGTRIWRDENILGTGKCGERGQYCTIWCEYEDFEERKVVIWAEYWTILDEIANIGDKNECEARILSTIWAYNTEISGWVRSFSSDTPLYLSTRHNTGVSGGGAPWRI